MSIDIYEPLCEYGEMSIATYECIENSTLRNDDSSQNQQSQQT